MWNEVGMRNGTTGIVCVWNARVVWLYPNNRYDDGGMALV